MDGGGVVGTKTYHIWARHGMEYSKSEQRRDVSAAEMMDRIDYTQLHENRDDSENEDHDQDAIIGMIDWRRIDHIARFVIAHPPIVKGAIISHT